MAQQMIHHKMTKKFMISSMTSEQKLRYTNSPKTQFLQNFTKKKFMISSTQKTNAMPNKSPIINQCLPLNPPHPKISLQTSPLRRL